MKAPNRVAPSGKRQRVDFTRKAVKTAILEREYARIRDGYLGKPDSADEADDWSNAEEFKELP